MVFCFAATSAQQPDSNKFYSDWSAAATLMDIGDALDQERATTKIDIAESLKALHNLQPQSPVIRKAVHLTHHLLTVLGKKMRKPRRMTHLAANIREISRVALCASWRMGECT